jgi:hypothetical protein
MIALAIMSGMGCGAWRHKKLCGNFQLKKKINLGQQADLVAISAYHPLNPLNSLQKSQPSFCQTIYI